MKNTDTLSPDAAPIAYEELDSPPAPPADQKPKRGRPRKDAAAPAAAAAKRPRPTKAAPVDLASKLTELLTVAGLAVGMANPVDGLIISSNAQTLATALGKLAEENDSVRRVLLGLVTGSAWGAVLMAAGSIALPIAANHGAKIPMGEQMLAPYRAMVAPAPSTSAAAAS